MTAEIFAPAMPQPVALQEESVLPAARPGSLEGSAGPPLIAYMMSRFPKLTETFVLFEMIALQRQGAQVEVFPLLRARNTALHPEGAGVWKKFLELWRRPAQDTVMHPEAAPFVQRAHFVPLLSLAIVQAQLHYLWRKPGAYCGALWTLIRANWGSPNFLLGGLVLFPKTVYFAKRMQQLGMQHLHAHFASHPAAAAHVIHRLTGIPYSFTAHGADLQVDQHMLREKVADAKFVVSISHDNRELIADVCGAALAQKVRIVHCGVDTRLFHSRPPQESPPSSPLVIVCTGTLCEVKGHRYLIEACELLRNRQIPFTCQLIGDGPMRDELRKLVADARLDKEVLFLGRQTRQQIAARLQAADVLVAPSVPTAEGRREGIPVVLMEAMASGLPVVASRISGIPELVEDGRSGLLVPPRDSAALAGAIEQLWRDPGQRRELGLAGRHKVLEQFDVNQNARQLLALFTGDSAA